MKSVNLESMKNRQNVILNDFKNKEDTQNNNHLLLDLKFIEKIEEKSKKTQNTSRPNSTIPNSARKNTARQTKITEKFESHLTKGPSDSLKSIAHRDLPLINNSNQNSLGDYFLLSVENKEVKNTGTLVEIPSRTPSAISNNQKISYKCRYTVLL
jgi:hypothetical protein